MVGCRSYCVIRRVMGVDNGGAPVVMRDTSCCGCRQHSTPRPIVGGATPRGRSTNRAKQLQPIRQVFRKLTFSLLAPSAHNSNSNITAVSVSFYNRLFPTLCKVGLVSLSIDHGGLPVVLRDTSCCGSALTMVRPFCSCPIFSTTNHDGSL
jgi:hypothetical protein